MQQQKEERPKVICIGWHKTGTTSMGLALLALDYTVVGARLDLAESLLNGEVEPAIQLAGQFGALQDVPWAALYRELDEAYPGSKFILTVRNEDKWLHSAAKHFRDWYCALHEWLYGVGVFSGNEEIYLQRFRRHYREVEAYFADRPEDLLVMDLAAGDGWEKLCPFLDQPIPNQKFPFVNKGKHNYSWYDKAFNFVRSLVPEPIRLWRVELLERLNLHSGRNRFNNHYVNRRLREQENQS